MSTFMFQNYYFGIIIEDTIEKLRMSQGEYLEGYGSNLEENYWESELSQRNCHERRKVKKKQ